MKDPIDLLLEEHVVILAAFAPFRSAVADLRAAGEGALASALPVLRETGTMMATTLERHARKEDEALFPAVEARLGEDFRPTQVMRQEHRDIASRAARFRATLHELNEIEHPAIVAGGTELRRLAAGDGNAVSLSAIGDRILGLVDDHFAKEEQILFPLARQVLSDEDRDAVARHMERIENGEA